MCRGIDNGALILLLDVVGNVDDGILHLSIFGQILNLLLLAGGRFLLIGNDVRSLASGHGNGFCNEVWSGWASDGRSAESIIVGIYATLGTLVVAALLQLTTRHLVGIGIGPAIAAADGGGRSRNDLMSGQSGGQYEESRCESHCAVFDGIEN